MSQQPLTYCLLVTGPA
ncbi:hypothetical protein, partial [Proteus sp. fly-1067]